MAFKKCPGCNGKGKYKGLRTIEDPCSTCEGSGLVKIERDDEESGEWEDLPDTDEVYVFGIDEDDREDFYPFAQFIDDTAKFVLRRRANIVLSIRTSRQLARRGQFLTSKNRQVDINRYLVIDILLQGSNAPPLKTIEISWDDWGEAAQVAPSELRKIMETEMGRRRLVQFIAHRDFKQIDTGFLPGMRLVDKYLKARGL